MIKRFLANQKNIKIATVIIFTGTLLAKVAGFIKLNAIARVYGVGPETDIFWAAFAIPDVIFNLLIVGSFNAALIPVFTRIKKNKPTFLPLLTSNVLLLYFLVTTLLVAFLFILMPSLAHTLLIKSNFFTSQGTDTVQNIDLVDQERLISLFINISRLMLISPIILGLSSIISATLHTYKKFLFPSLAPLAFNGGILISLGGFIVFAPQMGIYALVYSTLIGAMAHLLIQLPAWWSLGFKFHFHIDLHSKDLREIVTLTIPRLLGAGAEQISIFFNTFWSLVIGPGALTIFKYATSLHLLPVHLIGGSIAQAVFPSLAELKNDREKFNNTYLKALEYIFSITIPIVVLIIVLRLPIVRLTLGAGRYTWNDTIITAFALAFLAPAVLLQSIASLNIRSFFAHNDTKDPLLVSLTGVLGNIIFSILLSNFFSHYHDWRIWVNHIRVGGLNWEFVPNLLSWFIYRNTSDVAVVGLALGVTMGLFIEILLSFILLKKWMRFTKSQRIKLYRILIHYTLIGGITLVIAYMLYKVLDHSFFNTTFTADLIMLSVITGAMSLLIYIKLAFSLKQIKDFLLKITKFIRSNKVFPKQN